jgi:hypothetical protein
LKATWAARIAQIPRSIDEGKRARIAAPITTVGSTNAAVSSPDSRRRPRKRKRAIT